MEHESDYYSGLSSSVQSDVQQATGVGLKCDPYADKQCVAEPSEVPSTALKS